MSIGELSLELNILRNFRFFSSSALQNLDKILKKSAQIGIEVINFHTIKLKPNKRDDTIAKMNKLSHSSSIRNKLFCNSESSKQATGASHTGEFNFSENINQWKKYLEVDEFVAARRSKHTVIAYKVSSNI